MMFKIHGKDYNMIVIPSEARGLGVGPQWPDWRPRQEPRTLALLGMRRKKMTEKTGNLQSGDVRRRTLLQIPQLA
jgi:hypothetical protein